MACEADLHTIAFLQQSRCGSRGESQLIGQDGSFASFCYEQIQTRLVSPTSAGKWSQGSKKKPSAQFSRSNLESIYHRRLELLWYYLRTIVDSAIHDKAARRPERDTRAATIDLIVNVNSTGSCR